MKKKYEKPTIVKLEGMDFPKRIIEASSGQSVCKQCSACHGCR